MVLWFGQVHNVSWIYAIWSLAATFNHLVSRIWTKSLIFLHFAVLGYAVAPIVPFSILILSLKPPLWCATILQITTVLWASYSTIKTYTMIVGSSQQPELASSKLKLLTPPVLLMMMYLVSLTPIRRWKTISICALEHLQFGFLIWNIHSALLSNTVAAGASFGYYRLLFRCSSVVDHLFLSQRLDACYLYEPKIAFRSAQCMWSIHPQILR